MEALMASAVEPSNDTDLHTENRTSNHQSRHHLVKRACRECRQQKLRCDVVQEPTFSKCSRCRRYNLHCTVDSQYKRIEKRHKYIEMEAEIRELRQALAQGHTSGKARPDCSNSSSEYTRSVPVDLSTLQQPRSDEPLLNSAVESLLHMRRGVEERPSHLPTKRATLTIELEDIRIPEEHLNRLFSLFFLHYHPFLPFLDPQATPQHYLELSPLLGWTIISVAARRSPSLPNLLVSLSGPLMRLIWSTFAEVPQSYHLVKALCLFCTWPLPTSSVLNDPTYMLCGLMMQVATQIGLHLPAIYAQDFTNFRVDIKERDLKDRLKTWAVCNIVAQSVSTAFGQRPITLYNWTLDPMYTRQSNFELPKELETRLRIEKFCDKVTKGLYSNNLDPIGVTKDDERGPIFSLLATDFRDLETELLNNISPSNMLCLRAAELHLRYSAFFDSHPANGNSLNLSKLYFAITAFLQHALELETSVELDLTHTSDYILQIIVSAGFALLKLLNSFFAAHIDLEKATTLFNWVVSILRRISILHSDRAARLANVLSQLWRAGKPNPEAVMQRGIDRDSLLQLKVRCRMSMSHVFDSVWRWRVEWEAKRKATPEPVAWSATDLNTCNPTTEPLNNPLFTPGLALQPEGIVHNSIISQMGNNYGLNIYDDMFNGFVDFPYDFTTL